MIEKDLSLAHLNAFYLYDILVGIQLDIVPQPDDRHNSTQFRRNLPSDHNDSVQQVSALIHVRKGNDSVSELQLDRIHLQKSIDVLRGADLLCGRLIAVNLPLDGLRLQIACNDPPPHNEEESHSQKEYRVQLSGDSQKG